MNKKINFFLVVNDNGTVRATRNCPDLKSNEISIGMKLEIPVALFQRPQLEANLTVSEKAVLRPVISNETVDSVRDAIEQGTGLNVTMRVIENEGSA